jgi:hypothetical protein
LVAAASAHGAGRRSVPGRSTVTVMSSFLTATVLVGLLLQLAYRPEGRGAGSAMVGEGEERRGNKDF